LLFQFSQLLPVSSGLTKAIIKFQYLSLKLQSPLQVISEPRRNKSFTVDRNCVRDETTTGDTTTKPAESAANIGRHSAAIEKYVYQDGPDD